MRDMLQHATQEATNALLAAASTAYRPQNCVHVYATACYRQLISREHLT